MPYAVSVPSFMPPGLHEIRVTWKSKEKQVPERTFTFEVVNPEFGKPVVDPDAEALKAKFPGAAVAVLQQGQSSEELGLEAYAGCADAYIVRRDEWAGWNTGGKHDLVVGIYGDDNRALIRFDLTALPKGAKVEAALLKLRMDAEGHANGKYAYRVLRPWSAGTGRLGPLDENGRIPSATGHTSRDALPGECAWAAAKLPESWAAPGCEKAGEDREAQALSASITPPDAPKEKSGMRKKVWVSWELTAAAKAWAEKPETNHGVLLAVDASRQATWDEKCGVTAAYCRSSDYIDPAMRPKLILVFRK